MDKAGSVVSIQNAVVRLKHHNKYASRGGLKLEKAVDSFGLDFHNKTIIDIGASHRKFYRK